MLHCDSTMIWLETEIGDRQLRTCQSGLPQESHDHMVRSVKYHLWCDPYSGSRTTSNLGRSHIYSYKSIKYLKYSKPLACIKKCTGFTFSACVLVVRMPFPQSPSGSGRENVYIWQRSLDWSWVTNNHLQVQEVVFSWVQSTDTSYLLPWHNVIHALSADNAIDRLRTSCTATHSLFSSKLVLFIPIWGYNKDSWSFNHTCWQGIFLAWLESRKLSVLLIIVDSKWEIRPYWKM